MVVRTPEIDLYAPATVQAPAAKPLALPVLIDCIADRVMVVREVGDRVPLGCERELLAQTLPHLLRLLTLEPSRA